MRPRSDAPGSSDGSSVSAPVPVGQAAATARIRKGRWAVVPLSRFERQVVAVMAADATVTFRQAIRRVRPNWSVGEVERDAYHMSRSPAVRDALAEARGQVAERVGLRAARWARELAAVAYSNVADYTIDPATGKVDVRPGVSRHALRAVQSIKVQHRYDENGQPVVTTEVKLWNKLAALDQLGRFHGTLRPDKADVTVNVAAGVVVMPSPDGADGPGALPAVEVGQLGAAPVAPVPDVMTPEAAHRLGQKAAALLERRGLIGPGAPRSPDRAWDDWRHEPPPMPDGAR